MLSLLNDIYGNPNLRTVLGFKGGTAAMLFYGLPRMSVDLDFNLLDIRKKSVVFNTLKTILPKHGEVREATEKRFTLFFLIRYEKMEHTIKIEISKRGGTGAFHLRQYLGISALVMKEEDMAAGKLAALITRRVFAMRDVFDIWFFLTSHWEIHEPVFRDQTGLSVRNGVNKAIALLGTVKQNERLRGLGELLDDRQKSWARGHLLEDALFALRLYRESLPKQHKRGDA